MKQFTIRDMLFVFLIVALALGWWFDRRQVPGRFQMSVTANRALVLDTATGAVWSEQIMPDGVMNMSTSFTQPKSAK